MSADIVERLEEESVRLSGHSLDRGSADAGIAANVASEAAETIASLRARLAEAERDRDRYASDAGERAGKLDAAEAEIERLTKERAEWAARSGEQQTRAFAAEAELAKAQQERDIAQGNTNAAIEDYNDALAELAKAREALEEIAETDVIYPPHDPGNYFVPEGREGPCAKIARAALAPAKTEAELRHECAASGMHDHDGCDCTAEELARRASPEGE